MPILSASSIGNQRILSFRVLLISTSLLSMAVALKLSVPTVSDFIVFEIPSIWSFFLSWLRPPYLYLVINCIIISIVASSKLQHKLEDPHVTLPPHAVKISADVSTDYAVFGGGVVLDGFICETNENVAEQVASEGLYGWMEVEHKGVEMKKNESDETVIAEVNGEDEAVMRWKQMRNGLERENSREGLFSNEKENQKPLFSSRFGHRKAVKPSPEGKTLGVSKPTREDTLENTWMTITEGRSMPLSRHLKKSDTWDSHARRNIPADENTPPPTMRKSETFNDGNRNSPNSSQSTSPGTGRIRREPSLSQDELNRRVEAFIKKFNDEMRLQRQESLNQYREMISSR